MGDWYIGEIRLFPMNYAPTGWQLCDGRLLPIQDNQALFSLLGNTFGGNGTTDFALPDLRGRAIAGWQFNNANAEYKLGRAAGVETAALAAPQVPAHSHYVYATAAAGTRPVSQGNLIAAAAPSPQVSSPPNIYGAMSAPTPPATQSGTPLNPASISGSGAGEVHANMQPYLVLNFCIATTGTYPPRN